MSNLFDKTQNGCLHFKFLRKNAVFCLLASNIWQFLVIFKKLASRLLVTIFETLSWLGLLARITTNHKHQKSHTSLLCREKVWAKNAFFKIRKITIF